MVLPKVRCTMTEHHVVHFVGPRPNMLSCMSLCLFVCILTTLTFGMTFEHFQKLVAQVGLCPPPLLGRSSVLISPFNHFL